MVATISRLLKVLNFNLLMRDIDPWFWVLMLCCVAASWSLVNVGFVVSDIEKGVSTLQAQATHTSTANANPVREAYLVTRGEALGLKYKQNGVARAELVGALDELLKQGEINLTYRNAILSGYDYGFVLK